MCAFVQIAIRVYENAPENVSANVGQTHSVRCIEKRTQTQGLGGSCVSYGWESVANAGLYVYKMRIVYALL